MDMELYEAVYQFELKGNFADAQDLLSRISLEGDEEDKSKAFFLLGKIQEVSENPQTAVFYYRQALANPNNVQEAYFLASRIATLDSNPERIVLNRTKFSAPIRKTFASCAPSILLVNNQIYSLHEEKFIPVPLYIPADSKIFSITYQGIWYSSNRGSILHFQSKDSKQPVHSYPFDSPIENVLPIPGLGAMVMTEKDFAFAGSEGIRFAVENRYRGCTPVGLYTPRNELVLNCQDNALHLLNAENGEETQTLPLIDPIREAILTDNGIYASSSNAFWYFRPQTSQSYLWENSGNPIEDATFFGKKLAVLESGGSLKLLEPETGTESAHATVDGESLFEIAKGALGVFSQEGALTVLDTNLRTLWRYHFGKPLIAKPLKSQGQVFLPFENNELVTISALHYGMKPILSQTFSSKASAEMSAGNWQKALQFVDSAAALEPGNPTASYLRAVYMEQIGADEKSRASAWASAVRNSYGNDKAAEGILSHYAKIIGASYVHFLPLSPRTLYPNLFSAGHNLFTVDPAAQTLLSLDPSTGEIRWSKKLGALETSPVLSNDASHLAIASGFRVDIHDLNQNGKTHFSELPGKPFQIKFSNDAVFISTWNGYLIKLLAPNYRIAWARKLFNLPFLFDISKSSIAVASLEGSLGFVSDMTGQNALPMTSAGANISVMEVSDSLLAVGTDQSEIRIYDQKTNSLQLTLPTSSNILSLKWLNIGNSKYLLAGLSDQKICLYGLTSKEPLWTYAGENSIYTTPVVKGNSLYIDQKSYVAKISLSKGTLEKRFPTPGGSGTPFILDNTLFCASPKRLLYAFPLGK
ncbi:MAG: hypothetical protein J6Z31_10470 [Fibrobacter sp.]|nr:hypothetical protein [Fibrobacter sp.]